MKLRLLILFILLNSFLWGRTITGRVIDIEKKTPVVHMYIITEKSQVVSNQDGFFKVEVKNLQDSLKLKKIGYQTKKLSVKVFLENTSIEVKAQPIKMDPIKVSGKKETTISAKSSLSIIEEKAIAEKSNFKEIFNDRADIKVSGIALNGERQEVSLLGHKSKHTMVLIDGVPVNSSGEAFDFSTIPVEIIKNIEILKNNAGVEAGSGGIAGAININTKNSFTSENIKTSLYLGAFGYRKQEISTKYTWNKLSLFANINKLEADNDFEYEDRFGEISKRENNQKTSSNYNLSLAYLEKKFKLKYSFDLLLSKNYLPALTTETNLFKGSYIKSNQQNNSLSFKLKFNDLKIEHNVFYNYKKSIYQNLDAIYEFYYAKMKNLDRKIGIIQTWNLEKDIFKHKVKIAADKVFFVNEDLKNGDNSSQRINDIDVDSKHFSLAYLGRNQLDFDLLKIENNFSFRSDFVDSNNQNIYRIGSALTYKAYWDFILSTNYGTSFVVPTFYDLYWQGGSQATGNPDLKTENSKGFDVNIKLAEGNNYLAFSYYRNEIENQIYWIKSVSWKPHNLGNSLIENYETIFKYHFLKFYTLEFNHLRTFAINKSNNSHHNKNLINTPSSSTKLKLKYKNDYFKNELVFSRTGRRWLTLDNVKSPLPAYEIFSNYSALNYEVKKFEFIVGLKLHNFLDERYEIIQNYPQVGYNWNINLQIQYKI